MGQDVSSPFDDVAVPTRSGLPRVRRIDVVSRRIAPSSILHAFYQQHPGIGLDVVALLNADATSALAEVAAGTLDSVHDTRWRTPRP